MENYRDGLIGTRDVSSACERWALNKPGMAAAMDKTDGEDGIGDSASFIKIFFDHHRCHRYSKK
jgi:hypothetical protein